MKELSASDFSDDDKEVIVKRKSRSRMAVIESDEDEDKVDEIQKKVSAKPTPQKVFSEPPKINQPSKPDLIETITRTDQTENPKKPDPTKKHEIVENSTPLKDGRENKLEEKLQQREERQLQAAINASKKLEMKENENGNRTINLFFKPVEKKQPEKIEEIKAVKDECLTLKERLALNPQVSSLLSLLSKK